MNLREGVQQVRRMIEERSYDTRDRYLEGIREMADASDFDRGQVCYHLADGLDALIGYQVIVIMWVISTISQRLDSGPS